MIEYETTERGFGLVKFRDRYGAKCSIQKSSLATEDAIWFGVDDAAPKIMASVAKVINPETNEMTGWVPYDIPKDVLLTTWMHLTREQVAALLPILQWFVETGELPESGTDAAKSLAAKDAEIERLESALDMAETAFCELADVKRECPECTGRGPGICPVCNKDTREKKESNA